MAVPLPEVPMLHVFSFLDAASLLRAGQVSKYWSKMADDEHLWRSLCRSRWRGPWEAPQVPAWKQLFLAQARRELRMARARPQDFSYREATGSLGILGPLAYLSGSGPSLTGQKSILCSVSSRRMLYAWDVQEGSMIWSSPAQRAAIKYLATLPQRSLAFTVDQEKAVKVWNCRDAEPLATRSMPKRCFSLEPVLTDDSPVLMVGDSEGDIHTLTVPQLDSVSLVHAFNYTVDHLHCSPNRKWVFAGGTHPHMMPKVFSAEGLLRPGDGAPLCASLPSAFCSQACWALRCANRVTMMFRRALFRRTGFSTFDLAARSPAGGTVVEAHQVASFMLPDGMESPFRMGVRDGTTIVFNSGCHLFLFSIHGGLLQRFDHHQDAICHLWMDSLHVLTASMDNYLHLYAWQEGGCGSRLRSCCHLEQRRADPTPSCYYSMALCDSASVVCVVSRSREASVLVMYSLTP
ncbi:F-box/WD repeat-containing protein 12 [Eptesicus fuscus]|uniref:F-box/WD repeat-containing protein 12 n=1 Tax=Eptesicus fuscus TaxID=29078 RepID=UPI002403F610|nr:F-box/WD repeat-containing protein 12 [Eptesicus fuscus]